MPFRPTLRPTSLRDLLAATVILWIAVVGCTPVDSNPGTGTGGGTGNAATGGQTPGPAGSGGAATGGAPGVVGTGGTTGSGGGTGPVDAGSTGGGGGPMDAGATGGAGSGGATPTPTGGATSTGTGGGAGRGGTGGAPLGSGGGGGGGRGGSPVDAGAGDAAGGRGGSGGAAGSGSGGAATGTGGAPTDAGSSIDAPPLPATVGVHVAGDSTAAIFPATDPTMRVGWAAALQPLFQSSVRVNDAALSGRSSKSFIDEGAWATLKAKIATGDYLFVQFAHNDEKSEDPARYTDPATTYRDYLKTFINGARERGGFPVLMTSICRRQFSGTTVTASHGAWTTALVAVGKETGTPVIDMEKKTRDWLTGLGPTNSVPMFATDDNTHLSAQGATAVARLAVAGIRELGLPLAERALP